jgi:hypothetical protein
MRDLTWPLMVRIAIGAFGVLAAIGGVVAVSVGEPLAGAWALVGGGVLIVAALFEVTRYGPSEEATRTHDRFEPTNEVFVDPTTGERIRVWFDPKTGYRRYEPDR